MTNPFVTTFGIEPQNYIRRNEESEKIISEFSSESPSNYVYIITGLRGSGKTVLMSAIANHFMDEKDWIVVDPGPKDNILENVASEIFETGKMKHLFLKGEFSFSFHGLTFSIEGNEPVSSVNTLLKKMLQIIKKRGKRVLITIDEVDNSPQMKHFIQAYQSLIRLGYPVMLLMTGLYENVSKLQEILDLPLSRPKDSSGIPQHRGNRLLVSGISGRCFRTIGVPCANDERLRLRLSGSWVPSLSVHVERSR